jgi:hypothetical protein
MDWTLEFLKDRYNEELSRFQHLEDKCAKFLTVVTIILGAVTAIGRIDTGRIFHPDSAWEAVTLLLFVWGVIFIVCAWGNALNAIRIIDSAIVPNNRETANWLLEQETENSANEHIIKCYMDAIESLGDQLANKAEKLERAFTSIIASAACLGVVAVLTMLMELSK